MKPRQHEGAWEKVSPCLLACLAVVVVLGSESQGKAGAMAPPRASETFLTLLNVSVFKQEFCLFGPRLDFQCLFRVCFQHV